MSFTITTDVFCDECGAWTNGVSEGSPNRASAWTVAKARGWKKIKGKHTCPMCSGDAEYKLSDGSYVWKKPKT